MTTKKKVSAVIAILLAAALGACDRAVVDFDETRDIEDLKITGANGKQYWGTLTVRYQGTAFIDSFSSEWIDGRHNYALQYDGFPPMENIVKEKLKKVQGEDAESVSVAIIEEMADASEQFNKQQVVDAMTVQYVPEDLVLLDMQAIAMGNLEKSVEGQDHIYDASTLLLSARDTTWDGDISASVVLTQTSNRLGRTFRQYFQCPALVEGDGCKPDDEKTNAQYQPNELLNLQGTGAIVNTAPSQ